MNLETVSPREAAKRTRLGEHMIRDAIASGSLPSVPVGKIGTYRRVRLVDLEAWLEALSKGDADRRGGE